MTTNAAYRNFIEDKMLNALSMVGFERFRKKSADKYIDDHMRCWVGLNSEVYKDHVSFEPFIGVHCSKIERFLSILRPDIKYNRAVATYAIHLGEIAPQEKSFRFFENDNIELEAARLARIYDQVGTPYAHSIANYKTLGSLLKERIPQLGAAPERYACCLLLMGQKSDAYEFVQRMRAQAPEYFSQSADNFLKVMDGG